MISHTQTGNGSNRPGLRDIPPSDTIFSAGRLPCSPSFVGVFPRTSAPPFRRLRSLLARVGSIPPTMASSSSFVKPLPPPLHSQRTAGRAVCLLDHEPVRIYVSLPRHPGIMKACHSTVLDHLGKRRALRNLERFYWWIGISSGTR